MIAPTKPADMGPHIDGMTIFYIGQAIAFAVKSERHPAHARQFRLMAERAIDRACRLQDEKRRRAG